MSEITVPARAGIKALPAFSTTARIVGISTAYATVIKSVFLMRSLTDEFLLFRLPRAAVPLVRFSYTGCGKYVHSPLLVYSILQ